MAAFSMVLLVLIIVIIALFFDFTNGFHDSANSIATVVSTKVLSPKQAVLLAAFFNFIAILVGFTFGFTVAATVSKIIEHDYITANLDIVPTSCWEG